VYACFIGEVKLGVGEHILNPELLGNMMTVSHWAYFHSWIIVMGISFVKISIGFFLLRLVQGKWYKVCSTPTSRNDQWTDGLSDR
jgi:hypothetical protein